MRVLLVATLMSLAVIGAGGVVWAEWSRPAGSPAAAALAQIPTSRAGALLEQERQTMILEDAASQKLTIVGQPKIAAVPTQPPSSSGGGGGSSNPVLTGPAPDPGSAEATAQSLMPSYGFSVSSQWGCLYNLWEEESGWRYNAENASGAYGIPQALPGSKMASAGADWQTDPATQIRWGLGYIQAVYGTPCGAWDHEEADGWY